MPEAWENPNAYTLQTSEQKITALQFDQANLLAEQAKLTARLADIGKRLGEIPGEMKALAATIRSLAKVASGDLAVEKCTAVAPTWKPASDPEVIKAVARINALLKAVE